MEHEQATVLANSLTNSESENDSGDSSENGPGNDPDSQEFEHITKPGITMAWHHLLFAHWRWSAEELQQRLPPGLTIETFDDSAWLGVVPFWMYQVKTAIAPRLPKLPLAKQFLELNLRTYVRYEDGRTGVWFFTLDCNHLPSVIGARIGFSLPYRLAKMTSELRDNTIMYQATRQAETSTFQYTPRSDWRAASDDDQERFLCERYRLFSYRSITKRILTGQVSHTPYEVADADTEINCDGFFRINGFEPPQRAADSCLVAQPVDVLSSRPMKA